MVIALISVNIALVVMYGYSQAQVVRYPKSGKYLSPISFYKTVLIHSIAIGIDFTAVTEASLYSQNFIICSKESFKLSFGTYFLDPGVIYVRKYSTELETSINVLRNKDHRFAELYPQMPALGYSHERI